MTRNDTGAKDKHMRVRHLATIALLFLGLRSIAEVQTDNDARQRPELVSLLQKPLYANADGDRTKLEANLAAAQAELAADPNNPAKLVWVGRRLGYLWRIHQAIEVFSGGIQTHPEYAPLYRHRGHRYITLRHFDRAIADLERAAKLIGAKPDEIEEDGMPNERNIPLTSLGFNVWYHLALARYLQGDFDGAARDFAKTLAFCRGHDDNVVAVSDWLYMSLRRQGRAEEAARVLAPIRTDMNIIENAAYHRRLLMYKGEVKPEDLLNMQKASELDVATYGYGVGNWFLYSGQREKAVEVFQRVVNGPYWPAFGFIAAEVELARTKTDQ